MRNASVCACERGCVCISSPTPFNLAIPITNNVHSSLTSDKRGMGSSHSSVSPSITLTSGEADPHSITANQEVPAPLAAIAAIAAVAVITVVHRVVDRPTLLLTLRGILVVLLAARTSAARVAGLSTGEEVHLSRLEISAADTIVYPNRAVLVPAPGHIVTQPVPIPPPFIPHNSSYIAPRPLLPPSLPSISYPPHSVAYIGVPVPTPSVPPPTLPRYASAPYTLGPQAVDTYLEPSTRRREDLDHHRHWSTGGLGLDLGQADLRRAHSSVGYRDRRNPSDRRDRREREAEERINAEGHHHHHHHHHSCDGRRPSPQPRSSHYDRSHTRRTPSPGASTSSQTLQREDHRDHHRRQPRRQRSYSLQ